MDSLDQPAGDPAWRFRGFHAFPTQLEVQRDFLTVTASLTAIATHPCAADLHRVSLWNSQGAQPVTDFEDFGHRGFGGTILLGPKGFPQKAVMGDRSLIEEMALTIPENLARVAEAWEEDGAHVFYCAWDGEVRATLRFGGGY